MFSNIRKNMLLLISLLVICKFCFADDCKDSGGPYIFITVHNEIKNIIKYDIKNKCMLTKEVLHGHMFTPDAELRSMAWGQYNKQESLYVADASTHNSQVLIYQRCGDLDNYKNMNKNDYCYVHTAVQAYFNEGADHTYGICLDDDRNLYVSFQHTNTVLRYEHDSFMPMSVNEALRGDKNYQDYFEGTFAQFGEPQQNSKNERGVRGILYVNDNIWIANEDLSGVLVMDVYSGKVKSIISLNSPISCYSPGYTNRNKNRNIVYCGTKSERFGGAVYSIDADTYEIIPDKTYHTKAMTHATGITSHNGILYVAVQNKNNIHMFDIDSTKHLGKFIHSKDVPGKIEQILLSNR